MLRIMEKQNAYPRTGIDSSLEARVTVRYLARLSSILQLMFDFEKDSEADAKTATSLAPAAIAASKPYNYLYDIDKTSEYKPDNL